MPNTFLKMISDNNNSNLRTGIGFDAHKLKSGIPLILGGVHIPYGQGLHGHSDGDVLIHSIIDALLGAVNLGDIGKYFPSEDPNIKGIDSKIMLKTVVNEINNHNWQINFIDTTIVAEAPKLSEFINNIKNSLSNNMNIPTHLISIKSKTTDGMGFIGRGEGISALSLATVQKIK